MAFSLKNVFSELLGSVDWLKKAEEATSTAESLAPLLIKTATDGYNAAKGNGSLMDVIQDIENDIPALESVFKKNNAEVEQPPAAVDNSAEQGNPADGLV